MKKYLYFCLVLVCLCHSIRPMEAAVLKKKVAQAKPSAKKPIISQKAMTHINDRHGPHAKTQNTSKFKKGYTDKKIQSLVKRVFQSNVAWQPSKSNPHRLTKDYTFKKPIGKALGGKPIKTLRIVSDKQGNIITAFPLS